MVSEDVYKRQDQQQSGKILQLLKQKKQTIDEYQSLEQTIEDTAVLAEMALEENDETVCAEVLDEVKKIEKEEERMRIAALLSGEYDHNNAIVTLHPGAGGTEAQDWALMLYRMYTRWGERRGYQVKLLDWLDGDEAGIKSATILIEGSNAVSYTHLDVYKRQTPRCAVYRYHYFCFVSHRCQNWQCFRNKIQVPLRTARRPGSYCNGH